MHATLLRLATAVALLVLAAAIVPGLPAPQRGAGPPPADTPLRFAGHPGRFVRPATSGPVRVIGSLPLSSYEMAHDPATDRLYAVVFPERTGWAVAAVDCATNKVVGLAPYPAALSAADIVNLSVLVSRLKQTDIPAVQYIRSRLSRELLEKLDMSDPAQPNDLLKEHLAGDVNVLIRGPLLQSPDVLSLLSERDRAFLKLKLSPYEVQLSNRRAVCAALGPGTIPVVEHPRTGIGIEPGKRARIGTQGYLFTLDTRSMRWGGVEPWSYSPPEERRLSGEWGRAPRDNKTGMVYELKAGHNNLRVWKLGAQEPVRTLEFEGLRRPYRRLADGLALDEAAGKLYATHGLCDERISVLDARMLKRLGRIAVGQAPFRIAVNPRTKRLFVSDALDSYVRVIDARTGKQIARFEMPDRVDRIVVCPKTGRIYVGLSCFLCVILQDR
jgi:hypothetical protein